MGSESSEVKTASGMGIGLVVEQRANLRAGTDFERLFVNPM